MVGLIWDWISRGIGSALKINDEFRSGCRVRSLRTWRKVGRVKWHGVVQGDMRFGRSLRCGAVGL